MQKITIENIKTLNLSYVHLKFIPADWEGTPLDLLNIEEIPAEYRIQIVAHLPHISDKNKRLFAVWCGKEVLTLHKNPCADSRSSNALNVAENFAHNNATKKELKSARDNAIAATIYAGPNHPYAITAAYTTIESATTAMINASNAAAHAAFINAPPNSINDFSSKPQPINYPVGRTLFWENAVAELIKILNKKNNPEIK